MSGERDDLIFSELNVLQGYDLDRPAAERVSSRGQRLEPSVRVSVSGLPLLLPERVLSAAASRLQTATGGYVALEDYAEGVAEVLTALQKDGRIAVVHPEQS